MKIRHLLFGCFALSLTTTVEAQQWHPVEELPRRGKITAITNHPLTGDIYVAVPPKLILKSADDGLTWTDVPTHTNANLYEIDAVGSLGFDPVTEALFVGTGNGIFHTPNDGLGWAHECFYWSNGQTGGCTSIGEVAVYFDGTSSRVYAEKGLSFDGGVSWPLTLNTGVNPFTYFEGSDLLFNDYLVVYFNGNYDLITRSGSSYSLVATLPPYLSGNSFYDGVRNSQGDFFLAVQEGWSNAEEGIFRSTDNGANWVEIGQGLTDSTITHLTIDPSSGQLFLTTETGGVFSSTDNGNTWSALNQGLPDLWATEIMLTGTGQLYVTLNSGGLFLYDATAQTWVDRSPNLYKQGQFNGFYFTSGGEKWLLDETSAQPFNSSGENQPWTWEGNNLPDYPATYLSRQLVPGENGPYAYGFLQLLRYNQGSQQWESAMGNLTDSLTVIRGLAAFGDTLFTANYSTQGQTGVFRSTDNGDTWNLIMDMSGEYLYNLYGVSGTEVWVNQLDCFGCDHHLTIITEQGGTWNRNDIQTPVSISGGVSVPAPQARLGGNGHLLLCVEGSDLYRYSTTNNIWQPISSNLWNAPQGLLAETAYDFEVMPNGDLYYSLEGEGTFYSSDDGSTWVARSLGTDPLTELLSNFTTDPQGDVFAISENGLYKLGETVSVNEMPTEATFLQAFGTGQPGQLDVRFQLNQVDDRAQITVFDLQGRQIARESTIAQQGLNQVRMTIPQPTGVVLVHLQSGSQVLTAKTVLVQP